MLGRHGIPFTETRFYELGGVPTAQIIRILSAETGVPVDRRGRDGAREGGRVPRHLHAVQPLEAGGRGRGGVPRQAADGRRQRRLPRHDHPHPRPARHPRLVRRDGDGRGHGAAQAGAGRVPGGGPAARRCRPRRAWCSRTRTSAWKRPAAPGMAGVDVRRPFSNTRYVRRSPEEEEAAVLAEARAPLHRRGRAQARPARRSARRPRPAAGADRRRLHARLRRPLGRTAASASRPTGCSSPPTSTPQHRAGPREARSRRRAVRAAPLQLRRPRRTSSRRRA